MTGAWIGVAFLLTGAAGSGLCICRERCERTRQLKMLEQIFEIAAGEIGYSRISLPEVLLQTAQKQSSDPKFNASLIRIAHRLCDGCGQDMDRIWREELDSWVKNSALLKEEKELLFSFPERIWYLDGGRQQAAVVDFSNQMGQAAGQALKKERDENKVTMLVSTACGIFTALLLL